jgi:glycosyltransferase involved in cell wall biosynthesis
MKVTYYYPWSYFHPAASGAGEVARQHLEYFRSRGFRPRIILVGNERPWQRREFERHYSWVDEIFIFHLRRYPAIRRLREIYTFGNCMLWHAAMCEDAGFRAAISQPADLVFLNYVFSSPLLDFAPPNAARVLESHDIMSKQFQIRDQAPNRLQHHLRTEFDLYRLYDSVLMINEDEAKLAKERSASNAVYVHRPVDCVPDPTASKADGEYRFDILFVGSNHIPNIEGVNWFYDAIFCPRLKSHGLRWGVVGDVCDALEIKDPQVELLGRVDNLQSVYAAAKTVIIPISSGTGTSIKTLQALGQGKAIVTTPVGRRGLYDCDEALLCFDFAEQGDETANAILELCKSPELRATYGRRAIEYVRANYSRQSYEAKMDELLSPLCGRPRVQAA